MRFSICPALYKMYEFVFILHSTLKITSERLIVLPKNYIQHFPGINGNVHQNFSAVLCNISIKFIHTE